MPSEDCSQKSPFLAHWQLTMWMASLSSNSEFAVPGQGELVEELALGEVADRPSGHLGGEPEGLVGQAVVERLCVGRGVRHVVAPGGQATYPSVEPTSSGSSR